MGAVNITTLAEEGYMTSILNSLVLLPKEKMKTITEIQFLMVPVD